MILTEKSKEVNFLQYTEDRKIIERRIKFKKELAEATNIIIAVFNKESEVIKINNSILVNIAMNCLIKQLNKLPEDEIIQILEEKALAESKK